MKNGKRFNGVIPKLLLTGLFVVAFSFTAYAKAQGYINGDSVNVRVAPSLDASIHSKLNAGQVVDILGMENNFYKVSGLGIEVAYISQEFMDIQHAEGQVNDNVVNIRNFPSTDGSQVVGQVNLGETYTILGQVGEWYVVDYNDSEAYIKKEFVAGDFIHKVKDKNVAQPALLTASANSAQPELLLHTTQVAGSDAYHGVVTSDTGLNLREAPSTESGILLTLPFDAAVDVLEVAGEWVKSSYDGQVGYLSAEFIEIRAGQKPVRVIQANSRGEEVVAYAKQFIGTPYRWAGTNLNTGVDCSGFVYSVMQHYGVYLNRSSRDMVHNGTKISKSELQPGDLVFFDTDSGIAGNISHVGIYIGNGQFIHSASPNQRGVMISGMGEAYYVRNYVAASRVL